MECPVGYECPGGVYTQAIAHVCEVGTSKICHIATVLQNTIVWADKYRAKKIVWLHRIYCKAMCRVTNINVCPVSLARFPIKATDNPVCCDPTGSTNFCFLRFHRRRHPVVSSCCFTGIVRVGVKIPQDGNRANVDEHVAVVHEHVWRTVCSVCATGARVAHPVPCNS